MSVSIDALPASILQRADELDLPGVELDFARKERRIWSPLLTYTTACCEPIMLDEALHKPCVARYEGAVTP